MPGPPWSYGITTVSSRIHTTLPATLESLARAGFDNPDICIDGAPKELPLPKCKSMVIREPALGHLGNWMATLQHIYLRSPRAQRYAVFEDDLLACSNLREYLERVPFPPNGYFNLLTHDENLLCTGSEKGWHASNQKGRGAVGLVFSCLAVRAILCSHVLIERPITGTRNAADGMVIDCLKPLGYREYIHYPSLIQHMEAPSTLGHRYGKVSAFFGEDFNPLLLLEGS